MKQNSLHLGIDCNTSSFVIGYSFQRQLVAKEHKSCLSASGKIVDEGQACLVINLLTEATN